MKRQFSFRFFGLMLAVVGTLALSGHFLHAHQLKRNAGYLLQQSQQAVERNDLPNALRYLSHYLSLRPTEPMQRAQYAVLLAKQAKTSKEKVQAFLALERAFRDYPDLDQDLLDDPEIPSSLKSDNKHVSDFAGDLRDIRRVTARIAMDLHQY